jgi:hypothetical protein
MHGHAVLKSFTCLYIGVGGTDVSGEIDAFIFSMVQEKGVMDFFDMLMPVYKFSQRHILKLEVISDPVISFTFSVETRWSIFFNKERCIYK